MVKVICEPIYQHDLLQQAFPLNHLVSVQLTLQFTSIACGTQYVFFFHKIKMDVLLYNMQTSNKMQNQAAYPFKKVKVTSNSWLHHFCPLGKEILVCICSRNTLSVWNRPYGSVQLLSHFSNQVENQSCLVPCFFVVFWSRWISSEYIFTLRWRLCNLKTKGFMGV